MNMLKVEQDADMYLIEFRYRIHGMISEDTSPQISEFLQVGKHAIRLEFLTTCSSLNPHIIILHVSVFHRNFL